MSDPEMEFIKALGIGKEQLKQLPDFMVRTDRDKIRIAFRSKLEPPIHFGEWTIATISPQDFINMSNHFNAIITDATKPK